MHQMKIGYGKLDSMSVSGIMCVLFGICKKSNFYKSALFCPDYGGRLNIKVSSYQYRKFLCGKTVVRSSYLHNEISYTGKTTFYIESGPRFCTQPRCSNTNIVDCFDYGMWCFWWLLYIATWSELAPGHSVTLYIYEPCLIYWLGFTM